MPIERYLENEAFEPEDVAVLTTAFEACLESLGLKDRADAMTELVARKIIHLALQGERDPDRLREGVLRAIRAGSAGT